MKKTLKILFLSFVLMVVTFAQAFLVSAEETVTEELTEDQKATLSYWTPERLKNATPATPGLGGTPSQQNTTAPKESPGEPGLMTSDKDGTP